MNCSTTADCSALIVPGVNDWCIEEVSCDGKYHQCIIWPRCRNFPWFGCLNAQEQCVTTRLEPNPSKPPSDWGSGDYLITFLLCISIVLIIAFASGRHAYREYNQWLRKTIPRASSARDALQTIVGPTPQSFDQEHMNMMASF
jgi:hypothetical protein